MCLKLQARVRIWLHCPIDSKMLSNEVSLVSTFATSVVNLIIFRWFRKWRYLSKTVWRYQWVVYSIPSLLVPFSSTETMSLSFESFGFNSYRSRFEPLPSAGVPSLLLSRGLERLQWKTTEITMVVINTIAPHVIPIINGRLDDLLDPSSLFPPVQDNVN